MKKRMIRLLLCAVAACLIPLSGCRQNDTKIAIFMYSGDDTFISEIMTCLTEKMPAGFTFVVRDAGNSQAVQNQQIVELIDVGYDLFVINAVDRLACSSIAEKCEKSGVPVIFFNREPLEDALTGSDVFYVGAAADSLGEKQADMVAAFFGGDFAASPHDRNGDGVVQLVILKGEQGHQDAEKRTDNCVSRLRELGYRVESLGVEPGDWDRRKGYDAMRLLHTRHGDGIELVFSNNDDMALGAIDYLREIELFAVRERNLYQQPFIIVGVDGTSVGLQAIERGLLYGTVNNDAAKQSDAILTLADYILNGKGFDDFPYTLINERYIYIDGDIITQANLKDYLY